MNSKRIKHKLLKPVAWTRVKWKRRLFGAGQFLVVTASLMLLLPIWLKGTIVLYTIGTVLVLLSPASRREKKKWIIGPFLVAMAIYLLLLLIGIIFSAMNEIIFTR